MIEQPAGSGLERKFCQFDAELSVTEGTVIEGYASLFGKADQGARVFSIDHGVAFDSEESDRGELWKVMRVNRLPADTVERLRGITPELLTERLAVLAQWKLADGNYVAVAKGANMSEGRGVRHSGDDLQMGLNKSEIKDVYRLLEKLLERIDAGEFELVPASGG